MDPAARPIVASGTAHSELEQCHCRPRVIEQRWAAMLRCWAALILLGEQASATPAPSPAPTGPTCGAGYTLVSWGTGESKCLQLTASGRTFDECATTECPKRGGHGGARGAGGGRDGRGRRGRVPVSALPRRLSFELLVTVTRSRAAISRRDRHRRSNGLAFPTVRRGMPAPADESGRRATLSLG